MPKIVGKRDSPPVRRILVPLDASRESFVALEAAVLLAARLKAEIDGLFVEDDNLLRAAGLACSRVVHTATAKISDFSHTDMEREMRLAARSAKAALVREANLSDLKWSFRIERGDVVKQILAAASGTDLVIMGRTSRRMRLRPHLGSTAQRLANSVQAVLFAADVQHHGPVACVYDGSQDSDKALAFAGLASRRDGGHLLVLLLGGETVRKRALSLTADKELEISFVELPDNRLHTLQAVLRRRPAELLVLPGGFPALGELGVDAVVSALAMPVLLVRNEKTRGVAEKI